MASIFQQVMQAQALHQGRLMNKPNVVGVAMGYKESNGVITDEPVVVVLVQQKRPLAALAADEIIPRHVDGVRTDVMEVGYIQAQQSPRDRFRPTIPPGVSLGHYKVTAGTFGTVVRDRTTGERLLLSNNHVISNCNEALVGDPVLQPSAMDGGKNPEDIVARLERFIPLQYLDGDVPPPPSPTPPPSDPAEPAPPGTPTPPPTPPTPPQPSGCDLVDMLVSMSNLVARVSGSEKRVTATVARPQLSEEELLLSQTGYNNLVDCALARPVNDAMFIDDILNIGPVRETKDPVLGMRVRKSGRTTGYTESTITLLNATVNVAYNTSRGTRTARFTGQVITDAMSQGGDSGSLIVDATENKAVGLLFAGSPLATIFTPIQVVLDALNITLG